MQFKERVFTLWPLRGDEAMPTCGGQWSHNFAVISGVVLLSATARVRGFVHMQWPQHEKKHLYLVEKKCRKNWLRTGVLSPDHTPRWRMCYTPACVGLRCNTKHSHYQKHGAVPGKRVTLWALQSADQHRESDPHQSDINGLS